MVMTYRSGPCADCNMCRTSNHGQRVEAVMAVSAYGSMCHPSALSPCCPQSSNQGDRGEYTNALKSIQDKANRGCFSAFLMVEYTKVGLISIKGGEFALHCLPSADSWSTRPTILRAASQSSYCSSIKCHDRTGRQRISRGSTTKRRRTGKRSDLTQSRFGVE
jgi:hypothetical protein